MPPSPTADRSLAMFLGGALGDALGEPVEFKNTTEIIRRFGEAAPLSLSYAGYNHISDDTQMTLFVAEGLIRAVQRAADRGLCSVVSVVARALLRWYMTQDQAFSRPMDENAGWLLGEPRLWHRRGPGNTNMSALRALSVRADNLRADNDSKGCGAIMRTAPYALMHDLDCAFDDAIESAAITHGHPSGSLSAGAFTVILHGLLRDVPLEAAIEDARRLTKKQSRSEETLEFIERGLRLGNQGHPSPAALNNLNGGWTGESALAIALAVYVAHTRDSSSTFASATWRAALHDGDSDSTATLVGQLIGAKQGTAALPNVWVSQLELREVIERIANDVYTAVVLNGEFSREDYPPN